MTASKARKAKVIKEERTHTSVHVRDAQVAELKIKHIKFLNQGNWHAERCNMINTQLVTGKIEEELNGMLKTSELLKSEYVLTKMEAINYYNAAQGAKDSLLETPAFKTTEKDIISFAEDYFNRPLNGKNVSKKDLNDKSAKFVE